MSMPSRRDFLARTTQAAGLLGFGVLPAWGQPATTTAEVDPTAMINRAVTFLRGRQGTDGSWSADRKEPGITALVVTGLLRSGRVTPAEPVITKGLAYLEQFIGSKGGLSDAPHSVYATSVALMAYKEANREGRYDRIIKGSQDFLKSTQID